MASLKKSMVVVATIFSTSTDLRLIGEVEAMQLVKNVKNLLKPPTNAKKNANGNAPAVTQNNAYVNVEFDQWSVLNNSITHCNQNNSVALIEAFNNQTINEHKHVHLNLNIKLDKSSHNGVADSQDIKKPQLSCENFLQTMQCLKESKGLSTEQKQDILPKMWNMFKDQKLSCRIEVFEDAQEIVKAFEKSKSKSNRFESKDDVFGGFEPQQLGIEDKRENYDGSNLDLNYLDTLDDNLQVPYFDDKHDYEPFPTENEPFHI